MKSKLLLFSLLLVLSFCSVFLGACTNKLESYIVGQWASPIEPYSESIELNFYEDKTGIGYEIGYRMNVTDTIFFTYSISGNTIRIIDNYNDIILAKYDSKTKTISCGDYVLTKVK